MTAPAEPRFLADAMLARLARWLRVLGADTALASDASDQVLVHQARDEQRILLTRDRHLVTFLRPWKAVLLHAERPLAQLREVVAEASLSPPPRLFSRCLLCNTPLAEVSAEELATQVPAPVRHLTPIRRCPDCGRVYWQGSHTRRMTDELAMALPGWFD